MERIGLLSFTVEPLLARLVLHPARHLRLALHHQHLPPLARGPALLHAVAARQHVAEAQKRSGRGRRAAAGELMSLQYVGYEILGDEAGLCELRSRPIVTHWAPLSVTGGPTQSQSGFNSRSWSH